MIRSNDKWILADQTDALRDLIDRKYLLHDKFIRFLNEYDSDAYINRAKKEIKLLLFNNKNLPIEYRKILEQNNKEAIKK